MDGSLLNIAISFIGGAIVGWLLEFLIDWQFWRGRNEGYREEIDELQGLLNRSMSDKATMEQQTARTTQRAEKAEEKISALYQQLKASDEQRASQDEELSATSVRLRQMTAIEQANESLRSKLTTAESRVRELETEHQHLSSKLSNDQTLLQSNTDEVTALRSSLADSKEQADALANERKMLREKLARAEAEIASVNARIATAGEPIHDDVDGLNAEIATTQAELEAARKELAEAQARLERGRLIEREKLELRSQLESAESDLLTENNKLVAAEVKLQNLADKLTDERMRAQSLDRRIAELESNQPDGSSDSDELRIQLESSQKENTLLRERLASLEQNVTRTAKAPPRRSDRLQSIHGIGNVFARRLNAANINTFAELAQLSPEQAADIVKAEPWQAVSAENWIEEARKLANGGDAA